MAKMVPPVFPHDLRKHPELEGERIVFDALAAALGNGWTVYYNQRVKGSRRPIDFLIVRPDGRPIAWEVKGGMVHAYRGAFRQRVGQNGQRKRIDPFGQLKLAVRAYLTVTGRDPATSVELAVVFPDMAASAFPWIPSPHILTREDLGPERLRTWLSSRMRSEPHA
jgi:hypothetical protein